MIPKIQGGGSRPFEHFPNRRRFFLLTASLIFIEKNSLLTMEKAVFTNISRTLSYNPDMEGRIFSLALQFTQGHIDYFCDELKCMNSWVKDNMLKTSFPATYIIMYTIQENNHWIDNKKLKRLGKITLRCSHLPGLSTMQTKGSLRVRCSAWERCWGATRSCRRSTTCWS